jgi:FAD/FMN-containing dehydrogenase
VRSLEVVTADGRARHVDEHHERDLFWALRGGKGAFGVVTALELELFEVPELTAGAVVFAGADAPAVLHAWREWVPTLSDATSTSIALMRLPDAPMVPEPLRGTLSVHLRVAHLGSQEDTDALLTPMRSCARSMVDDVVRRPYTDTDAVHRDPVDPAPSWERGALLSGLDAEAADALLQVAGPGAELPLVVVELRLMGGAMARPAPVDNAVAGREGAFSLMTIGPDVPGLQEAVPAAAEAVHRALAPWRCAGNVTNWLGRVHDRQQVSASWSFTQEARLRATKTLFDPSDVFSHGHSVLPSVNLADLADSDLSDVSDLLDDGVRARRVRREMYWDVDRCRWVRGPQPD